MRELELLREQKRGRELQRLACEDKVQPVSSGRYRVQGGSRRSVTSLNNSSHERKNIISGTSLLESDTERVSPRAGSLDPRGLRGEGTVSG